MTLDRERAAKASFPAAAVGGTVCGVQFLAITQGFTGANAPLATVLTMGALVFLITWLTAAWAFLVGLQLIGAPTAAVLDRHGQGSPASVAATGALLSAVVAGLFGAIAGGSSGATAAATFLLLPGACAGWVFYRAAWI